MALYNYIIGALIATGIYVIYRGIKWIRYEYYMRKLDSEIKKKLEDEKLPDDVIEEHRKIQEFLINQEQEVNKQFRSAKVTGYSALNEGRRYYLKDYYEAGLSDSEVVQRCFDDWGEDRTPNVFAEGMRLELTQPVRRPKKSARHAVWHGDGSIISLADGMDGFIPEPHIWDKQIAYGGDESNLLRYFDQFDIENTIIRGGRFQVVAAAERHSVYDRVTFESGEVGNYWVFVMLGKTRDCKWQFHDRSGSFVRGGVSVQSQVEHMGGVVRDLDGKAWSNATSTNSCSNGCIHENPWSFAQPGQPALHVVTHSDKNLFISPTNEGAPSKYSIYADSGQSPTCRTIYVQLPHLEHGHPNITDSTFYFREFRSVHIDGAISHIPDIPFLKTEGNLGQVVMNGLSYIDFSNGVFDVHKEQKLVFRDMVQDASNLRSWNRYKSGIAPEDVLFTKGADQIAFGSEGIKIGAFTRVNGKNQEGFIKIKGFTLNWGNIKYWFRKSLTHVFK